MKVCVTGATGFVGYHVARLLIEQGDSVRALVRTTGRLGDLACEEAVGDLRDPESLVRALDGCEQLYHVAADYRLWSRNPQDLYDSNVKGTENVLQAARQAGVHRVVYTSTVGALGIPKGESGTEETPVALSDMVGHYKRSKFLAEDAARRAATEHKQDVVIVNPSTPVGERDVKPTPTGKVIVDFLNRRMPAFIQTGLNLIDVRDVACGHLLAANRGIAGERYILGNQNLTLQQILQILGKITGIPAPTNQIPFGVAYAAGAVDTFLFGTLMHREPHIPLEGVKMARKFMYFDSSKAVSELGLPQSPVEEALARAVEWFRQNDYVRRS